MALSIKLFYELKFDRSTWKTAVLNATIVVYRIPLMSVKVKVYDEQFNHISVTFIPILVANIVGTLTSIQM